MTGFTKGSWRVDDSVHGKGAGIVHIKSDEYSEICTIWSSASENEDEFLANANLIAAAPDMYESLEWLETYAMIQVDRHPDAEDNKGWRSIIAALAKARGEKS